MSKFFFALKNKYIFLLVISISSSKIFADSINELDRLIVNGTRLDQNNITDLPLNISIITAEDINLSPAKTIPELLSLQPGIQKISQFGNQFIIGNYYTILTL